MPSSIQRRWPSSCARSATEPATRAATSAPSRTRAARRGRARATGGLGSATAATRPTVALRASRRPRSPGLPIRCGRSPGLPRRGDRGDIASRRRARRSGRSADASRLARRDNSLRRAQDRPRPSLRAPRPRADVSPPQLYVRAVFTKTAIASTRGKRGEKMERLDKIRLTRKDMLKLSAGGAGMFALTASGFAVPRGIAGGGGGGGSLYIEAFTTSPLIMNPFSDDLVIPDAMRPNDLSDSLGAGDSATAQPNKYRQDSIGPAPDKIYEEKYHQTLGQHQIWPGEGPTAGYFTNNEPIVYQIKVECAHKQFTSSRVTPINSFGKTVVPPNGPTRTIARDGTTTLPDSTIWGFNGTFPGPRINAEYHRACVVRVENWLGDKDPEGYDSQDFGSPARSFMTHLHNGPTAPESDGQPHYGYHRFNSIGRITHDAAWKPGEWVDQLYLGYAAGGDEREKQSFFWFHDHVHGHTGANVYKGMVGLMPLYDPVLDSGNEADPKGLRLPGVRTDNHVGNDPNAPLDGTFNVEYDIPLAFYDCRLDDGVTPHKDAHSGSGETHPGWWGMSYFRHFPNHGFVRDIFTVNGTAYPALQVKRRRYRLRFLDASISRIYEFKLMTGHPKASRDMGYVGDELQDQYRLPDGQQCMKFTQVAAEGGLLPNPIVRDSFELWPAKRREF